MKIGKIGITTGADSGKNNWDRVLDLVDSNFRYLEFYNKVTRVRYQDIEPLKKLVIDKGLFLTFHSMVQDLFCEDEDIARQEYYLLKGEIKIASLIGCKRVIFHINKKIKLNEEEVTNLRKLANFAKENDVTLTIENNHSDSPMTKEYIFEILDMVPEMSMCLDIGHLNIALNKGRVKDLESYVKKASTKIVQIHASSNDGLNDLHLELNHSSLDLLKKVSIIIPDLMEVDILIETRTLKQAIDSLELLKNEFK